MQHRFLISINYPKKQNTFLLVPQNWKYKCTHCGSCSLMQPIDGWLHRSWAHHEIARFRISVRWRFVYFRLPYSARNWTNQAKQLEMYGGDTIIRCYLLYSWPYLIAVNLLFSPFSENYTDLSWCLPLVQIFSWKITSTSPKI